MLLIRGNGPYVFDGGDMEDANRVKSIGLILLANLLETLLWGNLFYWSGSDVGWMFLVPLPVLHLFFVFLFAYGVHELLPRQPSCDEFAFGMGLVMPLSIPLLSIAFLVYANESPSRAFIDEFQDSISFEQTRSPEPPGSEELQERLQIEPLEDLLETGDPDLHRDAMQKLGNLEDARATQLLKRELDNQDPSRRLYAYHELEELSLDLTRELREAQEEVEEHAESDEAQANLGNCYLRFWDIGLLEDEIEQEYLRKAKSSYDMARELAGDKHAFSYELGKICFALEEYEQAKYYLETVRAREPDSVDVVLLLARTYFQLRELGSLKQLVKRLDDQDLEQPSIEEAVEFWAGQAPIEN
jgi:tetratricopeptide (TPR) repeat protein